MRIILGDRFTKLTAVEEVTPGEWLCKCDCGVQKVLSHRNLTHGNSKSCGCLRKDNAHRKHGHTVSGIDGKRPAIYRVWRSMMQRCYRAKDQSYPRYGGKGISVCVRWHAFGMFLADMGEVPVGLTIDRIDSNGNYEPENCRWATMAEQIRNRRTTKKIAYAGEIKPLAEWSGIVGIGYKCLQSRIDAGWSADRALTTPVRHLRQSVMPNDASEAGQK